MPRAAHPFATAQYRVLFVALTLSLFGGGVWLVAIVWQVIALGGGPVELSLVAAAAALGLVGIVLIGGVAADRIPQRRILIAVETLKSVVVAAVAALAVAQLLELWHLVVAALLLGVADGFFYPAYSAILPSILHADDLLAANGIEGVLRPVAMQAAGPALASAAIAIWSPALAFMVVSASQAAAAIALAFLAHTPVRRELDGNQHPLASLWSDFAGGFVYMIRTPWVLATLLLALVLVMLIMGPIEVLLPFAVRDQTGGGAGAFALTLAAFGLGGALGSITVASMRLPRRYLTVMNLLWGVGCVPLAIIGFTSQLWVMIIAVFVVGFAFSAATVIWGTLLQRRVPPELLGRVSSLDFFVSLALMPISMAVAGPVGEAVGLAPTFLVAGLVPPVLAVAVILIARLPRDEIDNPLDAGSVKRGNSSDSGA